MVSIQSFSGRNCAFTSYKGMLVEVPTSIHIFRDQYKFEHMYIIICLYLCLAGNKFCQYSLFD